MMRIQKPVLVALGCAAAMPALAVAASPELRAVIWDRDAPEASHKSTGEGIWGVFDAIIARLRRPESSQREVEEATRDPLSAAILSGESLEDGMEYKRLGLDPPTAALSQKFSSQMFKIRSEAEEIIGGPLPKRFTDAELMRYAIHHGFLRAHDDSGRIRALHHAATAAAATAEWLGRYPFASDAQLERFSHLVWWTEPRKEDSSASPVRPVLHVAVGRAVHECRGPMALEFANSVVTHVQRALDVKLKDLPPGSDRVDVVVYAEGTSALSASRVAWVLKSVVSTLSHHYPGRLHELVLLDLPRVLTWLVKGAKKLVHAETARKVQSIPSSAWKEENSPK